MFLRLQVQSQQHVRITRNTYDKWHLYPVMVNRIGTVYPCDSNKGFSSRFCVDSRIRHETPEEGLKTYQLKRCEYNNKDEVNGPNILNDIYIYIYIISVMYSCGPFHMVEQKQHDQLEPTYNSSVLTQDVVLKTCQKQWMIGRGGERGSGISVLMARYDDDDDDDDYLEYSDYWLHLYCYSHNILANMSKYSEL